MSAHIQSRLLATMYIYRSWRRSLPVLLTFWRLRGVDFPWYSPGDFVAVPACASRTNCSPDQYGFLPFAPGNSGRNILDGPGLQNINLSMMKNWALNESSRKRVQFRWEVFNIFNHPNFQLPDRNFNETAAGYISDVQPKGNGGPRIMQFALRYEY